MSDPRPRGMADQDYADEDAEVLRAVDAWRAKHRKFPAVTDIVRIMRELGWRRTGRAEDDK